MSTIVARLFDTYEQASQAVTALESSGVPHSAISLIANNADDRHSATVAAGTDTTPTGADVATGAGAGATLGTVLGGGAGLLAGLGMLAIPGVGPVVAAGWLIATAVGAGVGAASGGLLGSLAGVGVPEQDAHVYAEGVRRGGTLVTVRAEEGMVANVERVLEQHGTVDTASRGEAYRTEGWTRFDETAPAYAAGESATLGVPGSNPTARGMPIL